MRVRRWLLNLKWNIRMIEIVFQDKDRFERDNWSRCRILYEALTTINDFRRHIESNHFSNSENLGTPPH